MFRQHNGREMGSDEGTQEPNVEGAQIAHWVHDGISGGQHAAQHLGDIGQGCNRHKDASKKTVHLEWSV